VVFGTTVIARTKNYTSKANTSFQRTNADGFLYTDALNYLKAYLLDYFKRDIREIVQDLLIVRGKWTTQIQSQQVSDAYHGVLAVSEQIIKLDDGLGDEGELGQRVRRAMGRVVDRDPSSQKALIEVLNEINTTVLRLVNEAAQNLIIIGKNLKMLLEDIDRKEPQIIINWKQLDSEIESVSEGAHDRDVSAALLPRPASPGLRREKDYVIAPSRRRRCSLIRRPVPSSRVFRAYEPIAPFALTIRWHGMTMTSGLAPTALPTARAASRLPIF
jgi:hypothetical protein